MKKYAFVYLSLLITFFNISCKKNVTDTSENFVYLNYELNVPDSLNPEIQLYLLPEDGNSLFIQNHDFNKEIFWQKILNQTVLPYKVFELKNLKGCLNVEKTNEDFYIVTKLSTGAFQLDFISKDSLNKKIFIYDYNIITKDTWAIYVRRNEIVEVIEDINYDKQLSLGSHASLIIRDNVSLTLNDKLSISSDDDMTTISAPFGSISNSKITINSSPHFANVIINGIKNGVHLNDQDVMSFQFEHLNIFNCDTGMVIEEGGFGARIFNGCAILNCTKIGILSKGNSLNKIKNSFISNNSIGIKSVVNNSFVIDNSLVKSNYIGFFPSNGINFIVQSNFEKNNYGVSVNTDYLNVTKSNFVENDIAIEFNLNEIEEKLYFSSANVDSSNFINNDIHISVFGTNAVNPHNNGQLPAVDSVQNFSSNYWGTIDTSDINQKIINPEFINYIPFLNEEQTSAGVE